MLLHCGVIKTKHTTLFSNIWGKPGSGRGKVFVFVAGIEFWLSLGTLKFGSVMYIL